MRLTVTCFCALLALGLVSQASCMTNREFAESMLESAEDVEEIYPDDERFDEPEEGVIDLPGGPDDELDVESLLLGTSLPESMVSQLNSLSKAEAEGTNLGWWRRRRRRRRRPRPSTCNCRSSSCHCCIRHTFRVNLIFKKYRMTLNACAYVKYLNGNQIQLSFTLQRRTVFRRSISIRHPPAMCYGIPGFSHFAKVCLRLYNINLGRRSFCARIEGSLNLVVKRFRIHIKIGCFRLGALSENELTALMSDNEALMNYISNGNDVEKTDDLLTADVESMQEFMKYVEITEIPVDEQITDANDNVMEFE